MPPQVSFPLESEPIRATEDEIICDVTLYFKDGEIKAHRAFLIGYSEDFIAEIEDVHSKRDDTIILNKWTENLILMLLKFLYIGSIIPIENTIYEFLKATKYVYMDQPLKDCFTYLSSNLTPTEITIEIFEYAWNAELFSTFQIVKEYILKHITEFSVLEKYLELEYEMIEDLVQYTEPVLNTMNSIFIACSSWVNYDFLNRKEYFLDILFMSSQFITDENKDSLYTDDYRSDYVSEAFEPSYYVIDENIFVCSLMDDDTTCYKYNEKFRRHVELTNVRPEISHFWPVFYKGNIYFTCGKAQQYCEYPKICHRYNVVQNSWDAIDFKSDRREHRACVIDDKMYLIGGKEGASYKANVSVYDFETGRITFLNTMISKRANFGLTVHENNIYAIGGASSDRDFCNTIESLDPREGKWKKIYESDMIQGNYTAAAFKNSIYCSSNQDSIIKEFDIRQCCLDPKGSLVINDSYSLAASENSLYALTSYALMHLFNKQNIYEMGFLHDLKAPVALYCP